MVKLTVYMVVTTSMVVGINALDHASFQKVKEALQESKVLPSTNPTIIQEQKIHADALLDDINNLLSSTPSDTSVAASNNAKADLANRLKNRSKKIDPTASFNLALSLATDALNPPNISAASLADIADDTENIIDNDGTDASNVDTDPAGSTADLVDNTVDSATDTGDDATDGAAGSAENVVDNATDSALGSVTNEDEVFVYDVNYTDGDVVNDSTDIVDNSVDNYNDYTDRPGNTLSPAAVGDDPITFLLVNILELVGGLLAGLSHLPDYLHGPPDPEVEPYYLHPTPKKERPDYFGDAIDFINGAIGRDDDEDGEGKPTGDAAKAGRTVGAIGKAIESKKKDKDSAKEDSDSSGKTKNGKDEDSTVKDSDSSGKATGSVGKDKGSNNKNSDSSGKATGSINKDKDSTDEDEDPVDEDEDSNDEDSGSSSKRVGLIGKAIESRKKDKGSADDEDSDSSGKRVGLIGKAIESKKKDKDSADDDSDSSGKRLGPIGKAIESKKNDKDSTDDDSDSSGKIPDVKDKIPDVKEKTPDVKDKTPDVKDKIPDAKDKIPDVKDKTPDVKDKVPDVKDKTPDVKDKTPVAKDKTPDVKDKVPDAKDKTPDVKDKTPEVKDKTPEVKDKTPEAKDKTPDVKDKTPEAKDKTSDVKDKSPTTDTAAGTDKVPASNKIPDANKAPGAEKAADATGKASDVKDPVSDSKDTTKDAGDKVSLDAGGDSANTNKGIKDSEGGADKSNVLNGSSVGSQNRFTNNLGRVTGGNDINIDGGADVDSNTDTDLGNDPVNEISGTSDETTDSESIDENTVNEGINEATDSKNIDEVIDSAKDNVSGSDDSNADPIDVSTGVADEFNGAFENFISGLNGFSGNIDSNASNNVGSTSEESKGSDGPSSLGFTKRAISNTEDKYAPSSSSSHRAVSSNQVKSLLKARVISSLRSVVKAASAKATPNPIAHAAAHEIVQDASDRSNYITYRKNDESKFVDLIINNIKSHIADSIAQNLVEGAKNLIKEAPLKVSSTSSSSIPSVTPPPIGDKAALKVSSTSSSSIPSVTPSPIIADKLRL